MPNKERDYDNTVLSLRFTSIEAARFWRVMDQAKARNAYIAKSDVYRELLGLKPPDVLSKDEIAFFRSGDKASQSGVPMTRIHLKDEQKGKGRKSG